MNNYKVEKVSDITAIKIPTLFMLLLCIIQSFGQSSISFTYDDSLFIDNEPDLYNRFQKEIKKKRIKKITKLDSDGGKKLYAKEERYYDRNGLLYFRTFDSGSQIGTETNMYFYDSIMHLKHERYVFSVVKRNYINGSLVKDVVYDSSTIVNYFYRSDINKYEWNIYRNDSLVQKWYWNKTGDSGIFQNFSYSRTPLNPESKGYFNNGDYTLSYCLVANCRDFTFWSHNILFKKQDDAQYILIPISKKEKRIYSLSMNGKPSINAPVLRYVYKRGQLVKIIDEEDVFSISYLYKNLPKSVVWISIKTHKIIAEYQYQYEYW